MSEAKNPVNFAMPGAGADSAPRPALSAGALEPYLRIAIHTVPRCLGQLDRRPLSRTFGCADVHYWRYRLHDVANARLQEMAWLLALVYAHPLPGAERYHANERLRRWIVGALRFWASRQHRDGSLAEVYPYERSFCATAFSTYAMTEVWALLGVDAETPDVREQARSGIERAATWLAGHDKRALSNQMSAAAVALWNAETIVPGRGFRAAALAKLDRLLAAQTPDGAFPEYGGADYGYQSITLSALTHLLTKTAPATFAVAVARGGALLEAVVDGRGLYDYADTSRQTQYLYPAGLTRLGLDAVRRHLRGLARDEVISPLWMDDRYCMALATDYALAYLATLEETNPCS